MLERCHRLRGENNGGFPILFSDRGRGGRNDEATKGKAYGRSNILKKRERERERERE